MTEFRGSLWHFADQLGMLAFRGKAPITDQRVEDIAVVFGLNGDQMRLFRRLHRKARAEAPSGVDESGPQGAVRRQGRALGAAVGVGDTIWRTQA